MSETRAAYAAKQAIIDEIKGKLENAQSAVVIDYIGIFSIAVEISIVIIQIGIVDLYAAVLKLCSEIDEFIRFDLV